MEWISVNERLPEKSANRVLVFWECDGVFKMDVAWFNNLSDEWMRDTMLTDGKWYVCERVTHWAEITPPKEPTND